MDQGFPALNKILNEKGESVHPNFKGTKEEFKEFVLVDKFKLKTNKLYKEFIGSFTLDESSNVYLENDYIGRHKINGEFTFNTEFSDKVKEKLAQKLQKVFRDCREHNESLQNKRRAIEESAKKELEERILKNLEELDYIIVEPLSDVFNKRLKEKDLLIKINNYGIKIKQLVFKMVFICLPYK